MAATLLLARRDDFTSDVSTLNLLGYAAGLDLAYEGWTPAEANEGDEEVEEVLTLRAKGTSHDNLAAVQQALALKSQECQWYKDGSERYGVWLRAKLTNETGTRQAFLKSLRHMPASSLYGRATRDASRVPEYSLIANRMPWWEATSHSVYTATGISCLGGMFDYTTYEGSPGAVGGDHPARLALTAFEGATDGGGPLYRFWLGFRSDRFGARGNFIPVWNLRKAITFGADTTGGTSNADATAHDGYKVSCTFATTATLARRVWMRVQDAGANPADQRGEYIVLLRAKTTLTGTARVRLADGYYNTYSSTSLNTRSRVTITSTSWNLYELGRVRIPSVGRLFGGSNLLSDYTLAIDAERVSGNCTLEMDGLILIPANEGFVYAEGGAVELDGADGQPLYVSMRPDGLAEGVSLVGGQPQNHAVPKIFGGLPVGNGIVVLAGQRTGSSVKADEVNLSMQVYLRWKLLRGAE